MRHKDRVATAQPAGTQSINRANGNNRNTQNQQDRDEKDLTKLPHKRLPS